MLKIENQSNYLAKVVKLENNVKHPNADKLQGWIIDGNRVWTDMSYSVGDICIFFPVECQINPAILSNLNLFADKKMNVNENEKGFFDKNGRVRAIRLRGEPSEGFLLKFEVFANAVGINSNDPCSFDVNQEFDYISDIWVCRKYVVQQNNVTANVKSTKNPTPELFRFHIDTPKLAKYINDVNPNDIVAITDKWHGTSGITANIPIQTEYPKWKKLLSKLFNLKLQKYHFDNIYASRRVIKNGDNTKTGFYEFDIWTHCGELLKPFVKEGYTLYYEIVGYLPSGQMIQKDYDYGYNKPTFIILDDDSIIKHYKLYQNFGIHVYRITHTSENGNIIELSWQQVKEYCQKYGIQTVKELYYGQASSLYLGDNFEEGFLEYLTSNHLEQDCEYCKNEVPAEGICLRIESSEPKIYKLKSFRFLEKETKDLDENVTNIEENENTN